MSKTIFTREQEKLQALLREVRQESGLSQVELAKKLNRPQSYVSKYENGERRLDVIELREVCLALNTTLSKFSKLLERIF